jgi:Fuc2NAc and GlcNAc transferase
MTITVVVTLLLAALFCRAYLHYAQARQILDVPNERSSHLSATPSGGGIALMAAFLGGFLVAQIWVGSWSVAFITLSVAALLLSLLGFIDDLSTLSMPLRLLVYVGVSVVVTAALMQPDLSAVGARDLVILAIAAVAILWALNLYNFMDGIDGIAATQAILACSGAAFLAWVSGGGSDYIIFCLILAAAHGGFLWLNFPPARLFMGDAGSVATGFLMGGLALLGTLEGHLNPLCWLVLLAVFITDASWTLVWRLFTGQRFTEAHRMHAYQRLSRYWNSHVKVDALLLAINLLWLFPIAFALQAWPDNALIMVILAYLPLLAGMAKVPRLT